MFLKSKSRDLINYRLLLETIKKTNKNRSFSSKVFLKLNFENGQQVVTYFNFDCNFACKKYEKYTEKPVIRADTYLDEMLVTGTYKNKKYKKNYDNSFGSSDNQSIFFV